MEWLTYRGNNGRTGEVYSEEATKDFIAFAGNGKLFQLDLEGKLLSETEIPGDTLITRISAANGRIVAAGFGGGYYVFDFNGNYLWSRESEKSVTKTFEPLITKDRIIVAYSFQDNEESSLLQYSNGTPAPQDKFQIECYNLNGNLQWNFITNLSHARQPIIHNGNLYIASSLGLMILDLNNNGRVRKLLTEHNEGTISAHPMIIDNELYFFSGIGGYSIAKADLLGQEAARFEVPDFGEHWAADEKSIIVKANKGGLYTFNKDNSKIDWTSELNSMETPVIFKGHKFFISREGNFIGNIYGFLPDNKIKIARAIKNSATIWNDLTIGDNIIIFGTDEGVLRAINLDNQLKWEFDMNSPGHYPSSSVIVRSGKSSNS